VREALVKDGVGSNRFMVAGYGEYRPIATNAKNGNQQNRRVEVYLVAMPKDALRSSEEAPTVATPEATKPAAAPATDENLK